MFTVEHEYDDSVITIMDNKNTQHEIKAFFNDTSVLLVQYNDDENYSEAIELSIEMWEELLIAYQSPEGAYITR